MTKVIIRKNWNDTEKISMAPGVRMTRINREVYRNFFFLSTSWFQQTARHSFHFLSGFENTNTLDESVDTQHSFVTTELVSLHYAYDEESARALGVLDVNEYKERFNLKDTHIHVR